MYMPLLAHKKSAFLFQPLGVTLIISPWNFPFVIPLSDTTSALAAGNTVILRPSSTTPLTGLFIGELYREAGLPSGVLNVINSRAAQAEYMITHPVVQTVMFTGSVGIGRRVMELAARNLTHIVLELGGKDPMIVLDDADLELAARGAVWAAFMNTGQSCASIERVYVDAKIAKAFTARVLELTRSLKVGDPLDPDVDVGPMTTKDQRETVEAHIADARAKGARVLCGGERIKDLPGYFLTPAVLSGVDHTMKIMTEETFGPALPIMAFGSPDEALALANDCEYGLTASVWTRNRKKAAVAGREDRGGDGDGQRPHVLVHRPQGDLGGRQEDRRGAVPRPLRAPRHLEHQARQHRFPPPQESALVVPLRPGQVEFHEERRRPPPPPETGGQVQVARSASAPVARHQGRHVP